MLPLEPFVIGVAGAFVTESLKLYQFYHELPASRFRAITRSKPYRLIVILMITASGIVASAFSTKYGQDSFMAFIHGAFAGPLMRNILRALSPDRALTFGPGEKGSIKDLL